MATASLTTLGAPSLRIYPSTFKSLTKFILFSSSQKPFSKILSSSPSLNFRRYLTVDAYSEPGSENGGPDKKDYDFDLFTIGAGSGGVRASRFAANYGAKVAICELPFATISSETAGGVGGT